MKRVFIAIALFAILMGCKHKNNITRPMVKPLLEAVYASGFVVSEGEYSVFPEVEGYLADKLVNDGDVVRKGDVLFILEGEQQSARYRIAREAFAQASTNYGANSPVLRELQASYTAAKTKLAFDSINYIRYTNLLKSNATTPAEHDRMRLVYESSRQDLIAVQSRLERTRNQLYLELQNARNQLQIASDESGRYSIKSTLDGVVFKTLKEKGELVRRGEMVAVIGQKNMFFLKLNVDELDIERIHIGQRVIAKIDAYPDKHFFAEVTKIYPLVNQQQQSFRVDAALQQPLPGNFSGLALEANIVIRQKDKALVIPRSAVLSGDSVEVNTKEGIKKVKITKGIQTLDEIEVVNGLDSATELAFSVQ